MIRISCQLLKILSTSRYLLSINGNYSCPTWSTIIWNTIPATAFHLVPHSSNINNPKRTTISCDRNSIPIADAISNQVDHQCKLKMLEIASGTGQHLGFFAPRFPNIIFQPTEFDPINFTSIRAYATDCPTKNIREPIFMDVCDDVSEWGSSPDLQPNTYDYMFNCNMMHISAWNCSVGLFRAAAILLKPRGLLFTYGPYALNGVLTPDSNIQFDQSLRARNPEWGIRDITDLKQVAKEAGLELKLSLNMPSNNKFLTWIKGKAVPDKHRRTF